VRIREYRPREAPAVGRLIASTYASFNLDHLSENETDSMLGPFARASSTDPGDRREIAAVIEAEVVLVAADDGEIIGVLRGRPGRLHSLFVSETHHRRGVGRRLFERFEATTGSGESTGIGVASTLFAVPFYEAMGFKKTTGPRRMRSFDGEGLQYQPMKKTAARG